MLISGHFAYPEPSRNDSMLRCFPERLLYPVNISLPIAGSKLWSDSGVDQAQLPIQQDSEKGRRAPQASSIVVL